IHANRSRGMFSPLNPAPCKGTPAKFVGTDVTGRAWKEAIAGHERMIAELGCRHAMSSLPVEVEDVGYSEAFVWSAEGAMALQTELTARLGLRHPIIAAPLGRGSTPEFLAALAQAGAIGFVALMHMPEAEVRQILSRYVAV